MISRRAFLAGPIALALASRLPADSGMSDRPVLFPDRPWEGACAMPFSGGIWKVGASYRCWYLADFRRVCLAYSEDGLTWEKPDLGVVAGTNIVLEPNDVDTVCVWPVDGEGWVMSVSARGGGPVRLLSSPDGLRWSSLYTLPHAGDRTTLFFNHLTDEWVYAVRAGGGTGSDPRRIDRVVSPSLIPAVWKPEPWLRAEPQDGFGPKAGGVHQLYAVDFIPDGSRMIGLFSIWRGEEPNRPKLNDVCLGLSTDGETFIRSFDPILTRSEVPQAWNYGNVQGVTGGLIQSNGVMRLYASGRSGAVGTQGNGVCSMGYKAVTL